MREADLIPATVIKYDQKDARGTAETATFQAHNYEMLSYDPQDQTLFWVGTQGMNQVDHEPTIYFSELDSHDTMLLWTNESHALEQILMARSKFYCLWDESSRIIWEGYLTGRDERHSDTGDVPDTFVRGMRFDVFVPGTDDTDGHFDPIENDEAPRLLRKIQSATPVVGPNVYA
jgi:hypothetical protein